MDKEIILKGFVSEDGKIGEGNTTLKGIPLEEKEGVIRNAENIDVVPSNIDLESMEVGLVNIMSREYTLKRYVNKIKEDYDYVLIERSW